MNIIKRIGIKNFIKEIDKDIKVKFQKYDMECDLYEDIVYVGKTYNPITDKLFMDYVKELDPTCNVPVFILSILHEVGHIMTYDEEDVEEKDVIYALLRMEFNENKENEEEYVKKYFRIPLETNATEWGIRFAKENPELIKKYLWICK